MKVFHWWCFHDYNGFENEETWADLLDGTKIKKKCWKESVQESIPCWWRGLSGSCIRIAYFMAICKSFSTCSCSSWHHCRHRDWVPKAKNFLNFFHITDGFQDIALWITAPIKNLCCIVNNTKISNLSFYTCTFMLKFKDNYLGRGWAWMPVRV